MFVRLQLSLSAPALLILADSECSVCHVSTSSLCSLLCFPLFSLSTSLPPSLASSLLPFFSLALHSLLPPLLHHPLPLIQLSTSRVVTTLPTRRSTRAPLLHPWKASRSSHLCLRILIGADKAAAAGNTTSPALRLSTLLWIQLLPAFNECISLVNKFPSLLGIPV